MSFPEVGRQPRPQPPARGRHRRGTRDRSPLERSPHRLRCRVRLRCRKRLRCRVRMRCRKRLRCRKRRHRRKLRRREKLRRRGKRRHHERPRRRRRRRPYERLLRPRKRSRQRRLRGRLRRRPRNRRIPLESKIAGRAGCLARHASRRRRISPWSGPRALAVHGPQQAPPELCLVLPPRLRRSPPFCPWRRVEPRRRAQRQPQPSPRNEEGHERRCPGRRRPQTRPTETSSQRQMQTAPSSIFPTHRRTRRVPWCRPVRVPAAAPRVHSSLAVRPTGRPPDRRQRSPGAPL